MTTNRLLSGFICLFLIGALLGCADHLLPPVVTPGANRLRVKSIQQDINPILNTFMVFSYDGQDRLSSILAYQIGDSAQFPVEQTLYQYDLQNRLTQVKHSEIRRGSRTETYTLTYNAAGLLAQLTNSPSTFSVTPQYNAANQLTGYTKAIGVGGLRSSGVGSFTFTSDFFGKNLTAASETFSIFPTGGSPTDPAVYSRSISATYNYDFGSGGTNPFYGTFIIPAPGVFLPFAGTSSSFGPFYTLYGGIDNPFNLSPKNVVTAVITTGAGTTGTRYSYSLNAANLPTSRTTVMANGTTQIVTEVLRFVYEAY